MKQTATNQFSDGLNLDLHPIVTPNSVLTDNLNGTFITYNGNEFCLQNDRGNVLKATLTEGFVPIGIKEHNGVLYIVSYNKDTKEGEIGTYPGLEWPANYHEYDNATITETWKKFKEEYTPLQNYSKLGAYKGEYKSGLKVKSAGSANFNQYYYGSLEHVRTLLLTYNPNFVEEIENYFPMFSIDQVLSVFREGLGVRNTTSAISNLVNLREYLLTYNNGEGYPHDFYGPAIMSCQITRQGNVNKLVGTANFRAFSGIISDGNVTAFAGSYYRNYIEQLIENDTEVARIVNKYNIDTTKFFEIYSYGGTFIETSDEDAVTDFNTLFTKINEWDQEDIPYSVGPLEEEFYPEKDENGNLIIDVDSLIFDPMRSETFNFDLEHPVSIEVQNSYDGSVNLIITDNKNEPRLINSGFSVSGDKYKIIKRNTNDFLIENTFLNQIQLVKSDACFAKFELNDVTTGGDLKGGNYTFYAKLGDADGNQTDIVAESGIVSVFKGSTTTPKLVSGTLADERTNKLIRLNVVDINPGYSKLYLYYVREYSDTQGYLMTEAKALKEPFDIEDCKCNITFTGSEQEDSISIEDLNIAYHTADLVKTMTQQQDMLFLGNMSYKNYTDSDLDNFAKLIYSKLSYSSIATVNKNYTEQGDYYDVQNIYSKVGYWPDEYYRFGIVFLFSDGSKSSVFNMNGGNISFSSSKKEYSGQYANEFGIFRTPKQDSSHTIIGDNTKPWGFVFDCSEMVVAIKASEKYSNVISGYFIVRQKRIPEAIAQGLMVDVDSKAHVPALPWIVNGTWKPGVIESFVTNMGDDDNLQLKLLYASEDINGRVINPTEGYQFAARINIGIRDRNGWNYDKYYWWTEYILLHYDENGILDNAIWLDENPGEHAIKDRNTHYYFNKNYNNNGIYSTNPWQRYETSAIVFNGKGVWSDIINQAARSVNESSVDSSSLLGELIYADFGKDPWRRADDDPTWFEKQLLTADYTLGAGAVLSLEAELNPTIKNRFDGTEFKVESIYHANEAVDGRQAYTQSYTLSGGTIADGKAVYINNNNVGKVIHDICFASVIGNATDKTKLVTIHAKGNENAWRRNVVRGLFTPYIGVTCRLDKENVDGKLHIVQIANRLDLQIAMQIRKQDMSPYYSVSDRYAINNSPVIEVYRGDCFVVTETIRMIRNFIDPDNQIVETILKEDAWQTQYRQDTGGKTKWEEINLTDMNTASLGHWVTFKCLASSNIGLRSEDSFDTVNMSIFGNPKSFYPIVGSTSTFYKQGDSELFNAGYGITVGRIRNQQYVETPYVLSEYSNRIMFSNKQVINAFTNGYRIFQGLSYQDYDKQYGQLVKILPWENNLFCVMEHGLGLVGVNEQALMQTTTNQTIHIYGHGVLSDTMTIISQDYGTKNAESVVRTPIGIYGIDADAKKIWRFGKQQGFQTLSDMKIESFLNEYLKVTYDTKIGSIDIRTHYNIFKGDVIFTWYDDKDKYSICYNERQDKWTTRYDWLPLVSENINGEFYSLQYGSDSDNKVGIYSHEINYSNETEYTKPTKWYGEQHPFEFEFVVSDPIGVNKIFDNLQIISNNVQPKELEIEIIGDSYMFKRTEITDMSAFEKIRKGYEIANNETTSNIHGSTITDIVDRTVHYNYNKTLNQTTLVKVQELRDIYKYGRRMGNIQYRDGMWYTQFEPIRVTSNKDARIRDKWAKIRIRYSGEDLAVITAIKTIVNI